MKEWRIGRRRHVEPGDKRSPMVRLLMQANEKGHISVEYDQQFKTLWKAQRLGYVTEDQFITEKGEKYLESH